jgi:hypothetical protein
MSQRVENLKNYCEFKLSVIESLLSDMNETLTPYLKLRMHTKINMLRHLIDYDTYENFLDEEELNKYLEDTADIICGFYEDELASK